jgi:hypothetical protein
VSPDEVYTCAHLLLAIALQRDLMVSLLPRTLDRPFVLEPDGKGACGPNTSTCLSARVECCPLSERRVAGATPVSS